MHKMKYILFLILFFSLSGGLFGQLNLGNDTVLCEGESITLDATLSAVTNYLWSTGETSPQITVTQSGTYSVAVGSAANQNLILNGDFSNQGANWDFSGNFTEAYATELSYGGSNGSNSVAEIDAGDDNICGSADDMMLSQNISGLTVGQTYTLCFDYSIRTSGGPNPFEIELDIVGNTQYSITANNTSWDLQNICFDFVAMSASQLITLKPITTGAFGLGMVVDNFFLNGGFSNIINDEIIVTFIPVPTSNAGSDQTICLGDVVTLLGTGTGSNTFWNNGIINGIPFSPLASTIYTLTSSTNTCISSDQVTVTVITPNIVDAGPDQTICFGEQVTLSASGGSTYSWSGGVTNGIEFSPNTTTTYSVTGATVNSCQNTDEVTITVNPLPTITGIADMNICLGNSTVLDASGSATSYSWSGAITDGVSFIPLVTATYIVSALDANGCANSDQVLITVNDPSLSPGLDLGADEAICPGEVVQLNAAGVWTSFVWSNAFNSQSITVGDSGIFWCEVTNAVNCVFRDTLYVGLKESPQITILPFDTISCAPFLINFEALSNLPNTDLTWNFGDNSTAGIGNDVGHIYTKIGVFDVSLVATVVGYCSTEIFLEDVIHILPQPIALFTYNLTSSIEDKFSVQFTNNSLNYASLNWQFTSLDSSNLFEPNFDFNKIENPLITLTATNGYCSDIQNQTIVIPENLIYYVPNTFTPDGNKFNNVFKPIMTEGVSEEGYQLRIYDRWGELLFESNDFNVGWDGTYGTKIAKSDTYLWTIIFKENGTNDKKIITGHLNLIN